MIKNENEIYSYNNVFLKWNISKKTSYIVRNKKFFRKICILDLRNKRKSKYLCKSTLPSRIDVVPRKLIFWEFSTHNFVMSGSTFIKNGPNFASPRLYLAPRLLKSRNQVVQFPATALFQPPHHSKPENVFDFHIEVWR